MKSLYDSDWFQLDDMSVSFGFIPVCHSYITFTIQNISVTKLKLSTTELQFIKDKVHVQIDQ